MEKYCNKCKEIKNVSNFYKRNDRTNGYRYICKPCDHKDSLRRRKAGGWISEKKRQGPGSKHSIQSKKNSQRHRDELSDMYLRSLMTKKSKTLKPKDIPEDLIKMHRTSLKLKRELRKIKGELKKIKNGDDDE